MDSHLLIYDAATTQLMKEDGEITDAHLRYNSHSGNNDRVDPTWAQAKGYTGDAYAAIQCDNNFYELDYDDRSGEKNYNEHIFGKLVSGRVYRFVVHDYSQGNHMSDFGTQVDLMVGNTKYPIPVSPNPYVPYQVPPGNYYYWTVFDIKEVNGVWSVDTSVAAYNNTQPW